MGANLVVGKETLGPGVFASVTSAGFLVDVSSHVVVVVAGAQSERTPVERHTDDEFVSRAARVNPELKTVVLKGEKNINSHHPRKGNYVFRVTNIHVR